MLYSVVPIIKVKIQCFHSNGNWGFAGFAGEYNRGIFHLVSCVIFPKKLQNLWIQSSQSTISRTINGFLFQVKSKSDENLLARQLTVLLGTFSDQVSRKPKLVVRKES